MTEGIPNKTQPKLILQVQNEAGQIGTVSIDQSNDISIMSAQDNQSETSVMGILDDDIFSEEEFDLYNDAFYEALSSYVEDNGYAGYDISSMIYTNEDKKEFEILAQGGMKEVNKRNLTSEEISKLDRSQRQEILKDLFPEDVWETMNEPYGIDPSDKFMSAIQVDEDGKCYIDLTSIDVRPDGLKNPWNIMNELYNGDGLNNADKREEFPNWDVTTVYPTTVSKDWEILLSKPLISRNTDGHIEEILGTSDEVQAEEADNAIKRNLTSEEISQLDRSQRQEILKDLFPEDVWETMNKPYGIDPSDKFMSAVQVDEDGKYYIDLTGRDVRPDGLKNPWNIMNELYNGDGLNNADKREEFPTWHITTVGAATVSKDWEILLSKPLTSRNANGHIEVSQPDAEGKVTVGNGVNNEIVDFVDPNIVKDENGVYQGEVTIEGQENMYAVISKEYGVATVSYYNMADLTNGVLKEGAQPVVKTVHNKDNSTVKLETNSNNEVVRTTTAADGQNVVVKYGANGNADKVTVNGNETYILNGTKWYLENNPSVEANIQVNEDGSVKINNTQEINNRLITRTYGANGALSEIAVGDKVFSAQNAVFENGILQVDTDASSVKLVVDDNGIYMQNGDKQNMLIDMKAPEQSSETNAKNVQGIFDDAFNEKDGWTKAKVGDGYVRFDGNAIYNIKQDGDNVVVTNDIGYKTIYCNNKPVEFYFPGDSNPQEVIEVPGEENTYEINGLRYEINKSGMLVEKTQTQPQTEETGAAQVDPQNNDKQTTQEIQWATYTDGRRITIDDATNTTYEIQENSNKTYTVKSTCEGKVSVVSFNENNEPTAITINGNYYTPIKRVENADGTIEYIPLKTNGTGPGRFIINEYGMLVKK